MILLNLTDKEADYIKAALETFDCEYIVDNMGDFNEYREMLKYINSVIDRNIKDRIKR